MVLEARDIPKMRCCLIFLECLFDGAVEDWQSQINMHCLKRFRSDCSPTHFRRRLGCSQEEISCFDAGLEPGAAEFAFFDHGGSRENPYYTRLGDRRVNDALLNARLRVNSNQQILPPITCGNQFATEILIESLRRRAFSNRHHSCIGAQPTGGCLVTKLQARRKGGITKHSDPKVSSEESLEEKIMQRGQFLQS